MSLERYRLDRVVIQGQDASVYEAVRAMESNHIGLVIVAEHGRVTGTLTDRDVALRVVGIRRGRLATPATPLQIGPGRALLGRSRRRRRRCGWSRRPLTWRPPSRRCWPWTSWSPVWSGG